MGYYHFFVNFKKPSAVSTSKVHPNTWHKFTVNLWAARGKKKLKPATL